MFVCFFMHVITQYSNIHVYIYIHTYIFYYIQPKKLWSQLSIFNPGHPMDNGQVFLRLDGHVGTTTWLFVLAGGSFQMKERNTSSIMSYLL